MWERRELSDRQEERKRDGAGGQKKFSGGSIWAIGRCLCRGACIAVSCGVLAVLLWQIGRGIRSVRSGEVALDTWLYGFGSWLIGRTAQEEPGGKNPEMSEEDPPGTLPADGKGTATDGTEGKTPEEPPEEPFGYGSAAWMRALLQKGEGWTKETLYYFDPDWVGPGAYGVVPVDGSGGRRAEGNAGDVSDLFSALPGVLILHSHSREAYLPAGTLYLPKNSGACRSGNKKASVVGVGERLRSVLEASGIPVVQWETAFDAAGAAGAYGRAEDAVEAYLADHPEVKLVIDLHRDAAADDRGNLLRAVTLDRGRSVAQVRVGMVRGSRFERLGEALYDAAEQRIGGINRPMTDWETGWNWEEKGVLTLRLEVGTVGNSPEEAARAVEAWGSALAEILKGGSRQETRP